MNMKCHLPHISARLKKQVIHHNRKETAKSQLNELTVRK